MKRPQGRRPQGVPANMVDPPSPHLAPADRRAGGGARRRPSPRRSGGLVALAAVAVLVVLAGLATAPAAASGSTGAAPAWSPQAATYGAVELPNQPVRMADGTVLRADVYEPAGRASGRPAAGRFPVLLQQTPYGSQTFAESFGSVLANTDIPYFVDRGYVVVIANVRGTGTSGGSWGLFDPVEATDGATLVQWAARLAHSDGRVGLFGESYMGIDQFLTAARLGPDSPVKAMFPVIAGNDLYQDTVTQGGLVDLEFSAFYLALVAGLDTANPLADPLELLGAGHGGALSTAALGAALGEEVAHAPSLLQYDAATIAGIESGGPEAFDGPYWAARSPLGALKQVVADHIPAFLVGGWHDLFQRGELLNYTGLQNLADGRPVLAPMVPGQPVTPRYQLLMGPWEHVTTGQGVDLSRLMLEWFDTWLLGQDTPLAHTRTPLHLNLLGTNRWVDAATWPLPQAAAHAYYLGGPGAAPGGGGTLTTSAPTARAGSDTLLFTAASSACDLQTDQWSAGLFTLALQQIHTTDPCTTDDATLGIGPGARTYTSAPMPADTVLGGPIDVTAAVRATTTDTELVATVEEVSPSGTSVPLTSGALLGSFRRLDPADTWTGTDGLPLLPAHPSTAASVEPVVPGRVTTEDIQVFPTFAEVPAGWRIRLTLTTSDTPHLVPTLAQLPHLVGGIYQVERHAGAASFANLPLAPLSAFAVPCRTVCTAG